MGGVGGVGTLSALYINLTLLERVRTTYVPTLHPQPDGYPHCDFERIHLQAFAKKAGGVYR